MSDAEAMARTAHTGQVDKQGRDYFECHLRPVATLLAPFGKEAADAGWLHDIVEDTYVTLDDLTAAGFNRWTVQAVNSVTRRPEEPYLDMVRRAAADPYGRLVKLMDNWVNLTGLDALSVIDPAKAASLRTRYVHARLVLMSSVVGAHEGVSP